VLSTPGSIETGAPHSIVSPFEKDHGLQHAC